MQIVVQHAGAVLQVLTFRDHISGDQHANFGTSRRLAAGRVGVGCEPPDDAGGHVPAAAAQVVHGPVLSSGVEFPVEVVHRCLRLAEDDQFLASDFRALEERFQGFQLVVVGRADVGHPVRQVPQYRVVIFQVFGPAFYVEVLGVERVLPPAVTGLFLSQDVQGFLRVEVLARQQACRHASHRHVAGFERGPEVLAAVDQ